MALIVVSWFRSFVVRMEWFCSWNLVAHSKLLVQAPVSTTQSTTWQKSLWGLSNAGLSLCRLETQECREMALKEVDSVKKHEGPVSFWYGSSAFHFASPCFIHLFGWESDNPYASLGTPLSPLPQVPRSRGLKPNYGSLVGNEDAAAARRDQWAHLAAWPESSQRPQKLRTNKWNNKKNSKSTWTFNQRLSEVNQFKSIGAITLNHNSRVCLRCFMNSHEWILWWDKGLRRDGLGENPCENPPRLQRFCDGALSKCGIQTLVNCKRQTSLSTMHGRFVQNRWPRHAETWFSWNQRAHRIRTFVWSNWGLCPRLWDGSHSWFPSRQVTLTLVTSWRKAFCKWIRLAKRKAKPFTACSILDTWWMNRLRFTCFTCFAHLHAMSWTYDGQAWTIIMQRSFQMHLKVYRILWQPHVDMNHLAFVLEKSACTEAARQLGPLDSCPEASKNRDWKRMSQDFLVQFFASFACLRKQAERHAERLGCRTSRFTNKTLARAIRHCCIAWNAEGEHVRCWLSSPTFELLLTRYCLIVHLPSFQAATSERRKNVCKEVTRFQWIYCDYKANSLQHFPTNLKSCKIRPRSIDIVFHSHLLVSSYGRTFVWACRPRLSARIRMLHEMRHWSTVASLFEYTYIHIFLKFGRRCCKKAAWVWSHFAPTTWPLLNEYCSFHCFSFHDFEKLEAENEAASAVGSLNPVIAVKTRVRKARGL